jgi:hypothetical protein
LLGALVGSEEAPAGFPAERIHAVREALVAKRLQAVARVWPALTHSLGAVFAERFREFAGRTPPPESGGALADGLRFAHTLSDVTLDDRARVEVLGVELHFRTTPAGLVPRKGACLRWAYLSQSRRFHLAWRLPLQGAGQLSVPLGWTRR